MNKIGTVNKTNKVQNKIGSGIWRIEKDARFNNKFRYSIDDGNRRYREAQHEVDLFYHRLVPTFYEPLL